MQHLHMALRFRSERGDTPPGRAIAGLRERIAAETDAEPLPVARVRLVQSEIARLMAIGISDMPPASDDIALLVDTLAFRLGETTRAAAWRSIGIRSRQGDELISRRRDDVSWPIWFTLRSAALQD